MKILPHEEEMKILPVKEVPIRFQSVAKVR